MPEPLRSQGEEVVLDDGFEVRWYAHRSGRALAFRTMGDVQAYMGAHGLPRPDELLAPVDY